MARSKRKGPKANVSIRPSKEPRIAAAPPSFRGGIISWRFNAVDKNGPFSWTNLSDGDEFMEVVDKLASLETMSEIEQGRRGCHFIEVTKLSSEARGRLTEIKLDDIDELYSIRLTGRGRVFCIHRKEYMRVLWFDPDHGVCISSKKHT